MKTHHTPAHKCPACEMDLDAVSGIRDEAEDRQPAPGDVTICVYCLTVSEFGEGLALEQIDVNELDSETQEVIQDAVDHLKGARTLH